MVCQSADRQRRDVVKDEMFRGGRWKLFTVWGKGWAERSVKFILSLLSNGRRPPSCPTLLGPRCSRTRQRWWKGRQPTQCLTHQWLKTGEPRPTVAAWWVDLMDASIGQEAGATQGCAGKLGATTSCFPDRILNGTISRHVSFVCTWQSWFFLLRKLNLGTAETRTRSSWGCDVLLIPPGVSCPPWTPKSGLKEGEPSPRLRGSKCSSFL